MTPPGSVADAFERYRARVESVASRILGDREEARDIASDAFLALLERGPDDPDAVFPWLLVTTRNRARNRARDRARAARRPPDQTPPHDPDPVGALGDRQAAALLSESMEQLGERDRLALRLRVEKGMPYEGVARELATTPQQARVVVHRAARRLYREAVSLIAQRRGVPDGCREALVRDARGHEGCAPCTAVAEELQAMARALPPPLSLLDRVLARFQPGLSRRPHGGGRLAEAVAALLVTVSMGVDSGSAATQAGVGLALEPRPSSVTAATAAIAPALAGARAARAPNFAHSLAIDDPTTDDESFIPQTLRELRLPVHLPDPLDGRASPAVDIRRFEIATAADALGRTRGLVFRLRLAGRIEPPATYEIPFSSAGGDCWGSIAWTAGEHRARLDTYCVHTWHEAVVRVGEADAESIKLVPRIDGSTLELLIPFERLGRVGRTALRPGARLTGVFARSWGVQTTNPWDNDVAPNEGPGITYTIAR